MPIRRAIPEIVTQSADVPCERISGTEITVIDSNARAMTDDTIIVALRFREVLLLPKQATINDRHGTREMASCLPTNQSHRTNRTIGAESHSSRVLTSAT